jgi:ABC-type branched-subunit amino acid transport system substrate-binding protein
MRLPISRRLLPVVPLVLALALAACAPTKVVVHGQEVPVAQAEPVVRDELAEVRAATANLPPAERAARLEAAAARYPGVPAAATALHEAARAWRQAGDVPRAAAAYGRLLVDHPLYPDATQAKYELARCDLDLGRARDGLATITSVYPRLAAAERPAAATAAAEGAEAAKLWPDAVRWWSEAAARSEEPAREAALARATDVIDGRLTLAEVEALRQALPPEAPVAPALAMKLVRVHFHQRDYPRAEEAARVLLATWPTSPWAADARATLDRIARLTTARPNVIGVAVPLSGQFKRWGDVILQGIALALGEGSPYKLVIRDTRGEPDGAVTAVEQLAIDEQAMVIVGGGTSGEADRAAATAEELQVPFISLSSKETVTDAGPHVFQNMLTASAQARALADVFMGKRGMKSFAIMYPSVPYGADLGGAFWDEVEARGGEVRAVETYPIDRTTFTPLVKAMVGRLDVEARPDYAEAEKEIKAREPDPFRRRKALEKLKDGLEPVVDFDAVLVADFARNVKLIGPALAVEDVVTTPCMPGELKKLEKSKALKTVKAVQLLGGNGWAGDPALSETGPGGAGRHLRCAIFVDGFFAGSARPETRKFADAYQRKFGAAPYILEASAYDAVRMIRTQLDGGAVTSREVLREGLASLKGFKGATGDISFSPRRTPEKELFFLMIDHEGVRELSRDELATRPPAPGTP